MYPQVFDLLQTKPSTNRFAFTSSIAADTWHPQKDQNAYEWWYFDALSDDGTEAIVIVFLDNFVYSPRYIDGKEFEGSPAGRIPAVSFTYFANGKQVYRAESEFSAGAFSAKAGEARCTIGDSGFRFDSASYGSGFLVSVELPLARGRTLRANLEWLSIESDLDPSDVSCEASEHYWNMVAPRSDVSGKITVTDGKGKITDTRSFRGTGYHDHNFDNGWLARKVKEWHWGRAHFADATAVFYRYWQIGDEFPQTRLLLILDGQLKVLDAVSDDQDHVRDKFGLRYPAILGISAEDGTHVESSPINVIDSSFYHLRFLSRIVLTLPGGRDHETAAITEFIAPRALKYKWLNWLGDLRRGRNGRAPLM